MNISDCMKRNVISIAGTATVREAAAIFAEKHIGLLPIVDHDMKVIGVVGLKDLLSLKLPDFVRFIADVDFVHDFGAVETSRPSTEALGESITSLMKEAITVDQEDVEAEIQRMAKQLRISVEDIQKFLQAGGEDSLDELRGRIMADKSLDFVYRHAIIQK